MSTATQTQSRRKCCYRNGIAETRHGLNAVWIQYHIISFNGHIFRRETKLWFSYFWYRNVPHFSFSLWRRVRTAYVNVRAWTLSSKHIIKLLSSDPLTIFRSFISYLRSYNFFRGAFGERFEKLTDYERLQFHFVGHFFFRSHHFLWTQIFGGVEFLCDIKDAVDAFLYIYILIKLVGKFSSRARYGFCLFNDMTMWTVAIWAWKSLSHVVYCEVFLDARCKYHNPWRMSPDSLQWKRFGPLQNDDCILSRQIRLLKWRIFRPKHDASPKS